MFHKQPACSQVCTRFLFHQLQCERCSDPNCHGDHWAVKGNRLPAVTAAKEKAETTKGRVTEFTPRLVTTGLVGIYLRSSASNIKTVVIFFVLSLPCISHTKQGKTGENIFLHTYFEYIKISFKKSASFNDVDTNLLILIKTTLLIQNFGGKKTKSVIKSIHGLLLPRNTWLLFNPRLPTTT